VSSVIRFLEEMGRRPAMSAGAYAASVGALDADNAQRRALLDRDAKALGDMLGGYDVRCLIAVPDPD
jgi:hypothetical protein